MSWSLYIIQCSDKTLYTGITTDIARRLKEHNNRKGAIYTRNKAPVKLVYRETVSGRAAASKREHEIKRLTRKQKLELIGWTRDVKGGLPVGRSPFVVISDKRAA